MLHSVFAIALITKKTDHWMIFPHPHDLSFQRQGEKIMFWDSPHGQLCQAKLLDTWSQESCIDYFLFPEELNTTVLYLIKEHSPCCNIYMELKICQLPLVYSHPCVMKLEAFFPHWKVPGKAKESTESLLSFWLSFLGRTEKLNILA